MVYNNARSYFAGRPLSRQLLLLLVPVLAISSILLLTSSSSSDIYSYLVRPSRSNYYPGRGEVRKFVEEEEARYAHFLEGRHGLIKKLGPNIQSFPTNGITYLLWDFFIPAFRCPHSTQRVGALGDGGKWICGVEVLAHERQCVIYSFGISSDSSFEADMLTRAPGCQVWGYDFSVSGFGPEISQHENLPARAHFHRWGLGAKDAHAPTDNPPMYTLQTLIEMNGHNFIDVLKIDIEGSEFEALTAFLQTLSPDQPLPFGQLEIEIHAWDAHGEFPAFLKWWESLEKAGLRPFWTEPNLPYTNNLHRRPDLAEYSFINIRGNHALVTG